MKFEFDPLSLFKRDEERDGDAARQRLLIHPVTGLWNNAYRYLLVVQAQQWAAATGQAVYYVEADLSNLGGVNDSLGSNTLANTIYLGPVARMWRVRLSTIASLASDGWSIPFHHGGDEISGLIGGVHEISGKDGNSHPITGPLDALHRDVESYGRMVGLDEAPHPKGGPKGIGLYYGITRVFPGENPEEVFLRADSRVTIYKRSLKQP
ncbi:MAG: hypothetical protein KDD66_18810 [Bdellovibrionales bacterium]|nr:hypothetical protein [Bdellovibrionales bacterium]